MEKTFRTLSACAGWSALASISLEGFSRLTPEAGLTQYEDWMGDAFIGFMLLWLISRGIEAAVKRKK